MGGSVRIRTACVLATIAIAACACSRQDDVRDANTRHTPAEVADGVEGEPVSLSSPRVGAGALAQRMVLGGGGTARNDASRKIIRNATLTIEVARLDEALDRLRKDTTAAGGYVESESRRTVENGVRSAEIACRVPAARLDGVVRDWRALGREEAFSLATRDITEQYSDTEVALRNQQRLEGRLLDLLNRQTNRVGDLLEIEKEAARVRSEIETLEARRRLWDQQVALAGLVVHLHEPRPSVAAEAGGALHTLGGAFLLAADNFVETVAGTIAALGTIVPLLAVAVTAWWLIRALWRRRRARRG